MTDPKQMEFYSCLCLNCGVYFYVSAPENVKYCVVCAQQTVDVSFCVFVLLKIHEERLPSDPAKTDLTVLRQRADALKSGILSPSVST